MAELTSSILEHECDTIDEKMQTIYQTDYIKRGKKPLYIITFPNQLFLGLNLTQYRTLMPAVESPVGIPVKSQSIGLGKGYRDPTMFRYSCFNKPMIHPPPPISFATSKIILFRLTNFLIQTFFLAPCLIHDWFKPQIGISEYQDTFSKTGLSIMKSRQQYAEPLPSSRRRFGDPCVI